MPASAFLQRLAYSDALPHYLFAGTSSVLANDTDTLRSTFKSKPLYQKWLQCCSNAVECCERNLEERSLHERNRGGGGAAEPLTSTHCPATWDGWGCWPATAAGSVAAQECPSHVFFNFDPICERGAATKRCLADATWFKLNGSQNEWSNYTTCASMEVSVSLMFPACQLQLLRNTLLTSEIHAIALPHATRVRVLRELSVDSDDSAVYFHISQDVQDAPLEAHQSTPKLNRVPLHLRLALGTSQVSNVPWKLPDGCRAQCLRF